MNNKRIFIIAEAGINHNGSLKIAKRMIESAAEADADAVKFQTFKAELMTSRNAPKAEYQKQGTDNNESQIEMLSRLELSINTHRELVKHCKKNNIMFLSSPFDLESIDMLNRLSLNIFKIPSGEITNAPYLKKIGSLGKRIILSTGISTIKEIKGALDILISAGTARRNIVVLHCNSAYPTPVKDVNLNAMLTIKKKLRVEVGYSDHTQGIEVAIAAAALGAKVIEKHFTLDKDMQGPDHKASLEPHELKEMARAIRNIEKALGNGIKRPSLSELKNINIVRKSIVAAKDIRKGEFFTDENITVKRPGTGISPMRWDKVIGKKAKRNFKEDELIEL